jgi:excisionase family DNA binding protein
LLTELARRGVDSEHIRREAMWRVQNGYVAAGEAIGEAIRQLRDSAETIKPPPLPSNVNAEVVETERVAASAREITPAEAADLLNCTAHRVRQLIRDERLKARRVGGRWLINRDQVIDMARLRRAAA